MKINCGWSRKKGSPNVKNTMGIFIDLPDSAWGTTDHAVIREALNAHKPEGDGWGLMGYCLVGSEKKPKECNCDLRTRLVGDGCEVCNPELALEHARDEITDLVDLVAALVESLEEIVATTADS